MEQQSEKFWRGNVLPNVVAGVILAAILALAAGSYDAIKHPKEAVMGSYWEIWWPLIILHYVLLTILVVAAVKVRRNSYKVDAEAKTKHVEADAKLEEATRILDVELGKRKEALDRRFMRGVQDRLVQLEEEAAADEEKWWTAKRSLNFLLYEARLVVEDDGRDGSVLLTVTWLVRNASPYRATILRAKLIAPSILKELATVDLYGQEKSPISSYGKIEVPKAATDQAPLISTFVSMTTSARLAGKAKPACLKYAREHQDAGSLKIDADVIEADIMIGSRTYVKQDFFVPNFFAELRYAKSTG